MRDPSQKLALTFQGYANPIGERVGVAGNFREKLETEEDYKRLFAFYRKEILPKNRDKIDMLREIGKKKRMVLMCFEFSKDLCHRGILSEELEKELSSKVTHL